MQFNRTNEQQALWQDIMEFANGLTGDRVARDEQGEFPEDHWQAVAEKGILGLCLPQEYGGAGHDLLTTVHALQALGYGYPDNGFALAVNGQMWSVQEQIHRFGTTDQKDKYLPLLVNGKMKGANGMNESESGSDAFNLATTAKKTDAGYILNGRKTYISMGPCAGVLLIYAVTNPEAGRWGLSCFIVEADSPGLVLGSPQRSMGLRTILIGDIDLNNVLVPEENLLGAEGAGASIFNASMEYERSFIFSCHVGIMTRQLEEAVDYAKKRKSGGQSIGKFQSVSNRIANMKVRLESSRLMLTQAAWLLDHGKPLSMEAALTKLVISESYLENSMDAVRIHGGRGYMTEFEVERNLRDAMGGVIYSGTSDVQRNLIAGLMGL